MSTSDIKYAGLKPAQMQFGKKNLLYAEMELLTGLKHLKKYKQLRKEEFTAKNLLKKTIVNLNKELKKISDLLPEIPYGDNSLNISKAIRKRDTLEKEILELQQKIAELE